MNHSIIYVPRLSVGNHEVYYYNGCLQRCVEILLSSGIH